MVPIGASTMRAFLVKMSRALGSNANNDGKLCNQSKLSNYYSPNYYQNSRQLQHYQHLSFVARYLKQAGFLTTRLLENLLSARKRVLDYG
jgi:hypothetical protein